MIIHNFEQQSPEWFEIRKGKLTGSKAQAIATCGKGLDTLIDRTMAEYYSKGEKKHFSNEHTERGNELEDQARSIYSFNTGNEVTQVGFIEHNEFIGCSPDGLVNDDSGIEIKCIDDYGYFLHMKNGESEIDSSHVWQMQMFLKITDRKWCDYIVYNPNFDNSMIVYRIYPDKEKFKKLEIGFEVGAEKIKAIKSFINNKLNLCN